MGTLDILRAMFAPPSIGITIAADSSSQNGYPGPVNPLTMLGNPDFDQGAAWMPQQRQPLSYLAMEAAFRTMGLAYRVVTLLPYDATSRGYRIDDEDRRGVTDDLDRQLGMPSIVNEWAWMARLYGGAIAMPYLEGAGSDLSRPLPYGRRYECTAVHVYAGTELSVIKWQGDPAMPGYRWPELVQITPIVPGSSQPTMIVHASRFVWMRSPFRLPSWMRMWYPNSTDMPVLEAYWQALGHRWRIDAVAANLAERIDESVLGVPNLEAKNSQGTVNGRSVQNTIAAGMAKMRSAVGMMVIDKEMTYERKPATLTGIDALDSVTRREVSSIEGIQQMRLFGDPPSGLNTDGGASERAWEIRVNGYRSTDLTAPMLQLYRRILGDELRKPVIAWPSVAPVTDAETAEIRLKHAQADEAYVRSGVLSPEEPRQRWTGTEYATELTIDPDDDAGILSALLDEDDDEPTETA